MKITLVGAGNLATHLGIALFRAGHQIVQVYSRTMASAGQLAGCLGCEPVTDTARLSPEAEVFILAVKDSVLPGLIPQVCAVQPHAVYAHTAGSIPMDVFRGEVSSYGVFYPMQTFSKAREVDFSVIPCFLEASGDRAAIVLKALAGSVSRDVRFLSSEKRRYLHLAAVFACNFANHCYALADEVLRHCDVPFDVLLPLIDETAAKVHALSPVLAQTGPAVRYDANVMEAQTALMADMPVAREIYERLSLSIHQMNSAV